MSLAPLRAAGTERFRHVRVLLAIIREREAAEGRNPTDETRMLRGLVYVQLYAALEFSASSVIQESLRQIGTIGTRLLDLKDKFHTVALNHLFQALATSPAPRLKKRLELVEARSSEAAMVVNDTLFADLLMSVSSAVLADISRCMCLSIPALDDPAICRYIDEVMERRHAVAHGRESAVDVGSRMTATQFEIRLVAVQSVVDQLTTALEELVDGNLFLRAV